MRSLLVLALVAACGDNTAPISEPAAGCNPLIGDDCLSPFPSSFYETADPTTTTGVRVAIPDGVLPKERNGTQLSPARLNRHDGVSPATPFVVYFAAGVDATQLPTLATLDQSILPTSTVQVLDTADGTRVPVFAELDANAFEGDRQSLIIRPQVRLTPNHRYAIALVGLDDASGAPLAPAGFVALRDRHLLSKALTALQPEYEQLFTFLAGAGVARGSLTLAWTVTTGSDADSTGHLLAMRDTALAMVPQLTWTITQTTDTPDDPQRLREIIGTFQVPSFLVDDTNGAVMNEAADGTPVLRGLGVASFAIEIPQCAKTATGPLPVLVYGHGLFGTAAGELSDGYNKQVGELLCMIEIGTDWIGLAEYDFPTLANLVVPNLNNIHITTDRLQQAHVNAQVLTRLFTTRMIADPALQLDGHAITDGSERYYSGISNGGIQGGTFMALSQDIERGALNVPGCEWSLLMFRSNDFAAFQSIIDSVMPDKVDQEILMAMIQPEFDFSDPISFATRLATKRILVQESIGDSEVTNVSTRILARTIGLHGIDLETPVFGIPVDAAPLDSAYTQWDITPTPLPPVGNIPSTEDNNAHYIAHRLTLAEQQLKAFLTATGQVTQVCPGPCVCNYDGGTCMIPPGV